MSPRFMDRLEFLIHLRQKPLKYCHAELFYLPIVVILWGEAIIALSVTNSLSNLRGTAARWGSQALPMAEKEAKRIQQALNEAVDHPDSLSLLLVGTPFQHSVWQALCCIPAGETISYSALASRIGKPQAVRAVAQAVGANTIAYFIPCHRVIEQSGGIGGYRWGIGVKQQLLNHEQQLMVLDPRLDKGKRVAY